MPSASDALANTAYFTAASVALELVLGLAIALAVARAGRARSLVYGAILVPWAGVPRRLRELLLEHPDLAVHNLHHNAPATAEMALALLLAAAKSLVFVDRALRYNPDEPGVDLVRAQMLREQRRFAEALVCLAAIW